jgi:hypothetical protein
MSIAISEMISRIPDARFLVAQDRKLVLDERMIQNVKRLIKLFPSVDWRTRVGIPAWILRIRLSARVPTAQPFAFRLRKPQITA